MSTTVTKTDTLQNVLNQANPQNIADALRAIQLGNMVVPTKTVVSQAGATGITLSPAALSIVSLRVVTGGGASTAATGTRLIADSGAAASATVATLSDDGKTLTFEAGVIGAVVTYMPRSAADVTAAFGSY